MGLTYDEMSRATAISSSASGTSTFRYDGDGRRVERVAGGVTTRFVYDGDQAVIETNGSNAVQLYRLPGVGYVKGGVQYYEQENAQGSVLAVRDASGAAAVQGRTFYDAYGVEFGASGAERGGQRFAGQRGYQNDDATGMQLLGARYYLPVLGRFLTQDPIGHEGGLNLYAYCGDSPLLRVDPSGDDWDWAQYSHDVMGVFAGYGHGAMGMVTGPFQLYNYYATKGVSWGSTVNLAGGMWSGFIGGFSLDASPDHFGESMFTVLTAPLPAKGAGALLDSVRMAGWARMAGVVRVARAASKAGNYGLGTLSAEETMAAGEAFVGPGARVTSIGSLESADGLRHFRPPSYKPRLGKIQANFESRGQAAGRWTSNGHVDVRK